MCFFRVNDNNNVPAKCKYSNNNDNNHNIDDAHVVDDNDGLVALISRVIAFDTVLFFSSHYSDAIVNDRMYACLGNRIAVTFSGVPLL